MASRPKPYDLVLTNVRVLTLDPTAPYASAVLIQDGRLAWVGDGRLLSPSATSGASHIDCGGRTLVPGFIDAHCHLLAYAASLVAVDCRPTAVSSISDIVGAIRMRAADTPPGEWIRAYGYSRFALRERRHPTRWDLDGAAPNHPVRLNHRSGHACVLNSIALRLVGISTSTDEPPGATIARDMSSGEPNGLLLEMDGFLGARMPRMSDVELKSAVRHMNERMLSVGITAANDATPSNSPERWRLMRGLQADGAFTPTVTMMAGVHRLDDFAAEGIPSCGGDKPTLGHAKVMLTQSGGTLFPSPDTLNAIVQSAHRRGFPVAVHAVEAEAVITAADVLASNRTLGLRDRIEHAAECPPKALDALCRSGATVVTQPRFIHDSGDRYLAELGDNSRWLYRIGTLSAADMRMAAGSDAPVSEPHPLLGMQAAVSRRTSGGQTLNAVESVSAMRALRMHTKDAAYAVGRERDMGMVAAGMRADLTLLSANPLQSADIASIDVHMTIVGGRIAWRHDGG